MQKLRNHKHFVTFVCLILGAVLLTGAAVANIGNAGGYEAYKDGLLGLLSLENFSGEADISLTVDGVEILTMSYVEEYNADAKPGEVITHAAFKGVASLLDTGIESDIEESWDVVNPIDHPSGRDYTSYTYNTYSGANVTIAEDGTLSVAPGALEWRINSRNYTDSLLSEFRVDTEDEYAAKILNILEMGVDLVVGDLKNNFVYIGTEDGISSYRVSLSGNQLPEIVQAVLSLLTEDSLYVSDWGIETAPGFEPWSDLTEEELEEYWALHDMLWAKMYDDPSSKYYFNGHFVIFPDLSYKYYEDINEYFKTVDEIPLEDLLQNLEYAFMMMDKEPKIVVASCDLSLDENGNLVANTLSGTVEIELVNGQKHSITLTVDAKLDPLNGRLIDMPVISPDSTVYDYSQGNHENGYIYTITKNGITTTHSETEEQQRQALDRFYQMNGVERISDAASWTGSWFDIYDEYPEDLYGDGTKVECYEIDLTTSDDVSYEVDGKPADEIVYVPMGTDDVSYEIDGEAAEVVEVYGPVEDLDPASSGPVSIIGGADGPTTVVVETAPYAVEVTEPTQSADSKPIVVYDSPYYGFSGSDKLYIPVEQFESACATMFSAGENMKSYAENMGLTAPEVVKILLVDYEQITGKPFEGYVYWINN